MIYLISLVSGVLNGLFTAAAGQVMIFYLIFILKLDAYKSRATSICCISMITIITFIGYLRFINVKVEQVIIIVLSAMLFASLGSFIMRKIKSNILNLISGILITAISIYKLFWG
ncbi:MAG: sulfite exporter TauE/SafE family protein [Clostridia bacterium]|nr:sulfite exporter TauE/SafE family protein [Clostridia bacterium]MDD4376019.1 sulfite exporter TauE/SafE family protein [Clostridia bacterium]